ncbi:MAG: ABC transporter permease [Anaerolineae bacterium]|nr:ABC transporter permease [Anaerolineae bacterium]
MLRRILNIAWKDLLHLWHNRALLLMVIFGGATELLLMGWATGAKVDDLRMVVVDQDQSQASQELIAALRATDTLTLNKDGAEVFDKHDDRDAALDDLFTGGNFIFNPDNILLVEIPAGFEEALQNGQQSSVNLTLNGANSLASTTARRVAEEEIYRFGAVVMAQNMVATTGFTPPTKEEILSNLDATQPSITVRYNEQLDRAHYTTPSEAGFVLYIITIMIAAFMLAREREYGTFEQLLVMPMRPIEIIIGKAIPALIVGYANFMLLLAEMNLVFDIPVRGSLLLLLVLAIGYLFVELGRGFMVAMITRTQNQALLIIMLIAFVDITFAGYAVPVESMPEIMQLFSNLFPIRHWMIIMRGILQKDVGLSVLWPQLLWLAGLGLVINGVTLWFFRRSLGAQR